MDKAPVVGAGLKTEAGDVTTAGPAASAAPSQPQAAQVFVRVGLPFVADIEFHLRGRMIGRRGAHLQNMASGLAGVRVHVGGVPQSPETLHFVICAPSLDLAGVAEQRAIKRASEIHSEWIAERGCGATTPDEAPTPSTTQRPLKQRAHASQRRGRTDLYHEFGQRKSRGQKRQRSAGPAEQLTNHAPTGSSKRATRQPPPDCPYGAYFAKPNRPLGVLPLNLPLPPASPAAHSTAKADPHKAPMVPAAAQTTD